MTVCEIYQNKTGFYKVDAETVVMLGSWLLWLIQPANTGLSKYSG
jgi:hypothetical protein